ncbi:hypothetical protein EV359DRAFT_29934, partial [Lentinula novae-zelandiae]
GLSYNLYAHKLLQLNVFPESVYTMQTEWYKSVQSEFFPPFFQLLEPMRPHERYLWCSPRHTVRACALFQDEQKKLIILRLQSYLHEIRSATFKLSYSECIFIFNRLANILCRYHD